MSNSINLDSDYDDDFKVSMGHVSVASSNEIPLDTLPEDEKNRVSKTINAYSQSAHSIALPRSFHKIDPSKITVVPTSAGRVSEAAQNASIVPATTEDLRPLIADIEAYREVLAQEEIPLPEIADLDNLLGPDATTDDKRGFMIQVNELVADILKMISKLNDRDRQKNDHMKKEYGMLNHEIGHAIEARGKTNFWSNVGALFARIGGSIIGGAIGSESFTKAADALGQQIPGLTGILTTGHEVTQTMSSNKLSLITTEMQNISQKSGDNSGWKNELTQSLNDVRQWMTSAARSN
jgi:hypothetical protein